MTERWILAIDHGSGGPKVAAVSLGGEVIAAAHRGVHIHVGTDGAATQDVSEWWAGLVDGVHELLDHVDPAALHAVGITGQWGSTVPVAADGSPAGDCLMWADTRGRRYAREVLGGPVSVQGYAPQKVLPFIRITGGAPSLNGADPTGHSLVLQKQLADVYDRTAVLLEPVDYYGLRLTGRAAATPASMILSWLTDNRPGAPLGYVAELVRRARRDPARLPELVPTGSVLGPLLPDVADELGVAAGVPVIAGVPDLHAAIVGSGSVAPYDTHMTISTTAWLGARVPFKKTDVLHSIATVPGLDAEHPVVANNHETGGAALQWLREQIISPPDALAGGGSGVGDSGAAPDVAPPSFEDIIALAESVPAGSEGVLFTPWLSGERSPVEDKHLRASFLNMSLRTDRAMLVRAVLEGVALNGRWLFDHYEKFLGRRVPSVRMMGGGAQSDLWCRIHAGALDRPVEQVADPRNAQLRGIALWARVCLGELTLEDVPALVPVAEVFHPEPADREAYAHVYQTYRRLYAALKGVHHRLNA